MHTSNHDPSRRLERRRTAVAAGFPGYGGRSHEMIRNVTQNGVFVDGVTGDDT